MKRALRFAILLAVTASASAQSGQSMPSRTVTAERLVNYCKKLENVDIANPTAPPKDHYEIGVCTGFIFGIIDAETYRVEVIRGVAGQKDPHSIACIPINASVTQLAKVIVKYGNDHPDDLNDAAIDFAYFALMSAFPCK